MKPVLNLTYACIREQQCMASYSIASPSINILKPHTLDTDISASDCCHLAVQLLQFYCAVGSLS